jgi:hypothetical protein
MVGLDMILPEIFMAMFLETIDIPILLMILGRITATGLVRAWAGCRPDG